MIHIRIGVEGNHADAESLREWLSREDGLRGAVRSDDVPQPHGTMGTVTEIVVAAASSSALVALARAVPVWLIQRRSDLKVTIKGPKGQSLTVEARRAADAEKLLRQALEWSQGAEGSPHRTS